MKRDYYELLGVQKAAPIEDIKGAYRKLAIKYHPDKNPGDKSAEDKFKEINEAYEVLSNVDKRAQYDHFGADAFNANQGQGAQGQGAGDYGDFSSVSDIFGDMFGDIFGGGSKRGGQRSSGDIRRGTDLRYELELTLEDAIKGREIPVSIPRSEVCSTCSGSGSRRGTSAKTCTQCKGSGQVRYSQGFFSFSQACPKCKGSGRIIESPCPSCGGVGTARATSKITVRIPQGVDDGTSLRVNGAGNFPEGGGTAGDLFVVVRVKQHPNFQRHEDDLLTKLNVSYTQAVFGADLDVKTVEGSIKIKIPSGTQPGTTMRIRGEGVPHLGRKGRGDLLVKVMISVPKTLTDKQRTALRELAGSFGETPESQSTNPFKKVFGR